MKRIGLAGGIGSGKSTASEKLKALGFGVVDADDVAREVVEPGTKALATLVDAFGGAILNSDGSMNREFVAELAFHDKTALRRLNAITHPAIGLAIAAALDRSSFPCMFVALPLIRAEHRQIFNLDEIWVVETSPEIAIQRLVRFRSFTPEQARARLSNQPSNETRRNLADRMISNDSDESNLYREIERVCRESGLLND